LDEVHRNYEQVERQISGIRQAADAASLVIRESSGSDAPLQSGVARWPGCSSSSLRTM
jgi:hypothetical protein